MYPISTSCKLGVSTVPKGMCSSKKSFRSAKDLHCCQPGILKVLILWYTDKFPFISYTTLTLHRGSRRGFPAYMTSCIQYAYIRIKSLLCVLSVLQWFELHALLFKHLPYSLSVVRPGSDYFTCICVPSLLQYVFHAHISVSIITC